MVTKGFVESIINKYKIIVRCPIYDRISTSSTNFSPSNGFSVCSTTGTNYNFSVGDVVFVGFEENDLYNGVVLGHLCGGTKTNSKASIDGISLLVENCSVLPKGTTIGNVKWFDIHNLLGVSSNISEQIENLSVSKDNIEKYSSNISKKISNQEKRIDALRKKLSSQKESIKTIVNLIGTKESTTEDTLFGRLNSYNNTIDKINVAMGQIPDGTIISEEIAKLNNLYNTLASSVAETSPSSDTDSNYMLGRAEKMITVPWEAKSTFSKWNSSDKFVKGNTYYGMPYTLFWYGYTYENWKKNSDKNQSVTAYCSGYGDRTGPKYGSCCADFVSEVFALPEHKRSCRALCAYSDYLDCLTGEKAKAYNIKQGDALVSESKGHVVWVGKVDGDVLTIYEQTPPTARKSTVSYNKNSSNGYLVYGGKKYNTVLRPTEKLLNLDANKMSTSSVIKNDWIYKGTKKYGAYKEQSLTEEEYMNNGIVFWSICKKAGWTAEAAAGAWANTYGESTGNPWSYGTGGGGLFGFTPFDSGTEYSTGIYDYALTLNDAEKRWSGTVQVDYINWQIKNIVEKGWTGIFTIRQPEERYWNYTPPSFTRIPKSNFNLDTYIKLNKKDYDATATICANLWLARYGVVDKTSRGTNLQSTIDKHTKKAEELYQMFIKY